MLQINGNTVRERLLSALSSQKIKPTSADFLSRIDFSSGTVSDYIGKNAQKEPSENFVRKICEIYNFPFEEIWLGKKGGVKAQPGKQRTVDPEYLQLLRDNDSFFKNQYAAFNAQVLQNLAVLVSQQQGLEALLKLNLEHTANIEAAQLGVPAKEIHDKINSEILNSGDVKINSPSGSLDTGSASY